MLDINISNFDIDQTEFSLRPVTVPQEITPAVEPETVKFRMADAESDIFDLARSIADRAYTRRRFRRSSSII